jgi:N-glycosidase YbiA
MPHELADDYPTVAHNHKGPTMTTITFYSTQGEYGCFSNFSPHAFTVVGVRYRTSEHYFQAQKFAHSPADMQAVIDAKTPKSAANAGRDRARPLRPDWETVKDEVMRQAIRHKFSAHEDIRAVLLNTGDAQLVENAPHDYYWGIGKNGSGKNMLGVILMQVRAELRQTE